MVQKVQRKYKDLIKNDGHFCHFCESPINSGEESAGTLLCRLCNKQSCRRCKYENMFYCHECKHSYCNKCSHQKKVLICDMHWNL